MTNQVKGSPSKDQPETVATCSCCKQNSRHKNDSYCYDCGRIKTIRRQQKFKSACVAHMSGTTYGECSGCNKVCSDCQLCIRHTTQRSDNIKISKLTGSAKLSQKVLDELAKCELLCHNCERKKYRNKTKTSALKKKCLNHLGGECTKCGYDEVDSALEFHHTDPTKKTLQLGDRGLKSFESVLPDLEVCEIVCSNCHSLEHYTEKEDERQEYCKDLNIQL